MIVSKMLSQCMFQAHDNFLCLGVNKCFLFTGHSSPYLKVLVIYFVKCILFTVPFLNKKVYQLFFIKGFITLTTHLLLNHYVKFHFKYYLNIKQ